jgi:hypothetical protein
VRGGCFHEPERGRAHSQSTRIIRVLPPWVAYNADGSRMRRHRRRQGRLSHAWRRDGEATVTAAAARRPHRFVREPHLLHAPTPLPAPPFVLYSHVKRGLEVGLEPAIRVVRDEDEARRREGQGHQAPCSCRAPSRQAGCPSFLFPTTTPTTRSELRTSALATVSSIQLVYLRGESHF